MASPYIVSRPIYGGPPLSQGPSMPFASMGPLPGSQRPYSGMPSYGPPSSMPALTPLPSSGEDVYEDLPNFRGTPGVIIFCLYLLLVSSLFANLGRSDFNFVLYLLGYHIWCIESDMKTTAGLRRLVRGARQFAVLLSVATLVDITWNFIAYSTWACDKAEPQLCFPEPQDLQVRWSYGAHSLALTLSLINLVLKVLVIFLTFSWVQQQRKLLGFTGSRGTAMSPPQAAPVTMCG